MKEKVARSVFWLVWSRGGVQLMSFLATVAVARLLSPGDYGLMALVGIWTGILASINEMGLGAATVQFQDLDDAELNTCFWMNLTIGIASYTALYVAAPAIAVWFHSPAFAPVLRVAGLVLILQASSIIPASLLSKRLELDKISQAHLGAMFGALPVTLGLAWAGAGVWALVASLLIQNVVGTCLVFSFARWWPGWRVGSRRLRHLLGYGLSTLTFRSSFAAYEQADAFVLGKVAGDLMLGFYSMAMQLAILPVSKISVMANQLTVPVMARLQDDPEAIGRVFRKAVRLVATVTLPACFGLIVVADDLVLVVLGPKWTPMLPVLRILGIFGAIRSVDVLFPPVLMARYRANFLAGYTLTLLVMMPLAFWGGATLAGAVGVATAWVLLYPIVMFYMAHVALREMRMSWRTLLQELWRPLVASLLMMLAVWVTQTAMGGVSGGWRAMRLALSTASGAVSYAAVMLALGGPIRVELQEVVGWLLKRRAVTQPGQPVLGEAAQHHSPL